MVIWIIGLSGAGKTTLGQEIVKQWRARSANTVLLDGDALRAVFAHDGSESAYSLAGRQTNAERLTELCALLDQQGINVVCCVLSIFPQMRAGNRQRFSRYFEIFLDAPIEALAARDSKALYQAALRGERRNVVGIDIPFPRPLDADLVIDSAGAAPDIVALASQVMLKAGCA